MGMNEIAEQQVGSPKRRNKKSKDNPANKHWPTELLSSMNSVQSKMMVPTLPTL